MIFQRPAVFDELDKAVLAFAEAKINVTEVVKFVELMKDFLTPSGDGVSDQCIEGMTHGELTEQLCKLVQYKINGPAQFLCTVCF